ncbi:hypothetical protein PGIGA_G00059800 [Pangasianodon gigas]|uniref:Uncharacterized protein n=1 Tax=Pangasianodon gigas TaxID=30993 RepID=A0ACC5X4P5_PANGG|nr:hypothetical protein [Pangasianodon gigas]
MANTDFHLQFQDFDDDVGVTERSAGATVVSMDGERFGKSPTQRRVAGPEDELLDGDDQTELLRSERKSAAFWTLEFYQTFFNVDTYQVLWVVPSEVLRWSSIVVALCLSGSVLVLTFWPVMRDDRPRVVLAVLSSVVALHVLLAIGCKVRLHTSRLIST